MSTNGLGALVCSIWALSVALCDLMFGTHFSPWVLGFGAVAIGLQVIFGASRGP